MIRRLALSLSIALTTAVPALGMVAGPASASCVPIDMMLPASDEPGAVVFVGTVRGIVDPTHTALQVDAWYLGDPPQDQVVVTGGRDPMTITSADWTPDPGERAIVVGTRADNGAISTGTCQQGVVTAENLATLQTRYGDPQLPPFPAAPETSPAASASPAAAGPDVVPGTGGSPAPSVVTMSPFPA